MGDNTNTNANASSAAQYVFVPPLFKMMFLIMVQFVVLAFGLHMICSSPPPQMVFTYSMLDYMTSLISVILVMFYLLFSWIKLCGKLLIFPTIQKPYYRQFTPSGFAASMKPSLFEGMHYKRWRVRAVLWFQTMSCYDATLGKPEGDLSPQQEQAFQKTDTLFKAALLSVLGENIVDPYASFDNGKDMWAALEAKFGVSRTLALNCMSWNNSMTTG